MDETRETINSLARVLSSYFLRSADGGTPA